LRDVDFGLRRVQLGVTLEQVAERSGVPIDELRVLDEGGKIDRLYAQLARDTLWQIEADRLLERSGLPECAELKALVAAVTPTTTIDELKSIERHTGSCAACRARKEYLNRHLGPRPKLGPALLRAFEPVARAPRLVRSAAMGAIMIGFFVAIPIVASLVAAIAAADPSKLRYTAALLSVMIVGGGSGGLAYGLVAGPSTPRGLRLYTASIIGVWTYFFATLAVMSTPFLFGADAGDIGELLDLARDPVGATLVGALGVLFGVILARTIASEDRRSIAPPVATPSAPAEPLRLPPVTGRDRWRTRASWAVVAGSAVLIAIRMMQADAPAADVNTVPPDDLGQLQAWVREHPRDHDALFQLARALGRLQLYGDALAAADSASRLAPDSAHYHYAAALALAGLHRWQDAWQRAETGVALAPTDPFYWGLVGVTGFYANEIDRSYAAFSKALELDPDYLAGESRRLEREAWQEVSEIKGR